MTMKTLNDAQATRQWTHLAREATHAAGLKAASHGLPITGLVDGKIVAISAADFLAQSAAAQAVRRAAS